MRTSAEPRRTPPAAPALVLLGVVVAVLAWLLPVSLKSVSRGLLRSAGTGTLSVAAYGRDLVDSEKIGPARLLLEVELIHHALPRLTHQRRRIDRREGAAQRPNQRVEQR